MDLLDIPSVVAKLSNRSSEMIVMPTEACNFRCVYCYEQHNRNLMSGETVGAVKKLITAKLADLDTFYLGWFGGEPLTARKIVLDVSEFVMNQTIKHEGLNYRGGISTNGYLLTRELFRKLMSLGILDYQVTLDGPRHIHDKIRVKANGQGTYDRIWQNLLDIKNVAGTFKVTLRIHFEPRTISHIDELIDNVREKFLPDSRFVFFFKAIQRLGNKNDKNTNVFTFKQEKKLKSLLEKKLYFGTTIKEQPPYVCYASNPNSLLVYPNGELGKCTVALYDSCNKVGFINNDGTVTLNSRLMKLWMRGFFENDLEVLACPLRRFSQ